MPPTPDPPPSHRRNRPLGGALLADGAFELGLHEGVEITVQDGSKGADDAKPTVKRNRFAADLVKVGDDWLLESLEQVAVNIS